MGLEMGDGNLPVGEVEICVVKEALENEWVSFENLM